MINGMQARKSWYPSFSILVRKILSFAMMIKFVKFPKRFPHVTLSILHENQEATM